MEHGKKMKCNTWVNIYFIIIQKGFDRDTKGYGKHALPVEEHAWNKVSNLTEQSEMKQLCLCLLCRN